VKENLRRDGPVIPPRSPGSIGIIFVNCRHGDLSRELSDGGTLSIFPLVGGGRHFF
jgi:molybdopterin converting factor small subunit